MTDINLKTLTPDTSLPTTGFLFGADSQASTNPSVYSTQTVATTLLGSTSLTGDTLTANAPVLNLTQTWNSVGTTFTGVRFNAAGSSSTNSSANSLLMDLQVGGATSLNFRKNGYITATAAGALPYSFINIAETGTPGVGISMGSGQAGITAFAIPYGYNAVAIARDVPLAFCSSNNALTGTRDLFLTRKNTRILQLGEADAATALAQTLSVQSVVSGTAGNVAGADFKITGSQGVGSGAGGSLIFQVAPAGSTATFTVTFTNGSATISGTGLPTTAGTAVAFTTTGALPTNFAINTTYFVLAGSTSTAITVAATAGGTAIVAGSAGSGTQTLTRAVAQNALADALTIDSNKQLVCYADNSLGYGIQTDMISPRTQPFIMFQAYQGVRGPGAGGNGFVMTQGCTLQWTGTDNINNTADLRLFRDTSNTLAQRNGVSAQTFRLYLSYTDVSNYTRLALKTATGVHTLETESAGSGEANIDLALTPKGTGHVRYGTHAAVVTEIVTGYIEIKDASGTVRKLAVVS